MLSNDFGGRRDWLGGGGNRIRQGAWTYASSRVKEYARRTLRLSKSNLRRRRSARTRGCAIAYGRHGDADVVGNACELNPELNRQPSPYMGIYRRPAGWS